MANQTSCLAMSKRGRTPHVHCLKMTCHERSEGDTEWEVGALRLAALAQAMRPRSGQVLAESNGASLTVIETFTFCEGDHDFRAGAVVPSPALPGKV